MRVNDLDENVVKNLLWDLPVAGVKKAGTYLTKPAGLYKTDAEAAAAALAAKKVDKATAAVDKTKDAIATAQSQQTADRLAGTLAKQKANLSAAKELAKTAPKKEFTTGQKIARPVVGTATVAGSSIAADRALRSDDKPAEPVAPSADKPAEVTPVKAPSDAPAPFGSGKAPAQQADDDIPEPPTDESIKESITDILKLSGQKSITSRDNIVGIIKPKEIVALHESKQLDECGGMMPNGINQTASLSINATAGSGEEVANMLAAIMNLAGVKPVTSDMLGGAQAPMPIVKAIDIVSRGEPDSMNDGEEQLSGMEEEYANTPEDPTEVPDFDSNKMAYEPNAVDVGDRMDGTMPKGIPGVTKESLAQAFEAFKNGQ